MKKLINGLFVALLLVTQTTVAQFTVRPTIGQFNPSLVYDFTKGGIPSGFSATRTSGGVATRVNSSGLIVQAEENLMLWSEDFTNSAWTKTNATATANVVTAPNGTLTGNKISESVTTNVEHILTQSYTGKATASLQMTLSVSLKAAERTIARVRMDGNSSTNIIQANIDLSNGTILDGPSTLGGFSNLGVTVENQGNGWYRVHLSATTDNSSILRVTIYPLTTNVTTTVSGNGNYAGTVGSGIYVWGTNLSTSPTYQTYQVNTSSRYAEPRFDYDPVTLQVKGLLLEEARTNLCVRSGNVSSAEWTVSGVVKTSTNNPDPFGTNTAALITADGASTPHSIGTAGTTNISYTSGSTYTCSIFIKAGTQTLVQLTFSNGGAAFGTNQYANFNLSTGTIGTVTGGTATITAYQNGWYRLTFTATATTTSSTAGGPIVACINSTSDTRNPTNTSSGTFYTIGAQVEVGSFATSYIPTFSVAFSRTRDVASTPLGSWWNKNEGSMVFEYTIGNSNGFYLGGIGNGPSNGIHFRQVNLSLTTNVRETGQTSLDFGSYAATLGSTYKMGIAYRSGANLKFVVAGSGVQTSSGTYQAGWSDDYVTLSLGSSTDNSSTSTGWVRSFKYYPFYLPQTYLQSLTQ